MITLRDYQQDLLDRARLAYQRGRRRICLQAPTGAGKSVIAAAFASSASQKGKRSLLVVHRREIVHQLANALRGFGMNPGIIMAGSDVTGDGLVDVASIQTLARRKDVAQYDLIFIDESHHAVADSYKKLLTDHPEAVHIGLTATPCRGDGRGLAEYFDELIVGPSIFDLQSMGYLAPIKMLSSPKSLNLDKVKITAGDYNERALGLVVNTPKLVADIVGKWKAHGQGNQTIVFAVNVEHSMNIASAFRKDGIAAEHLDGMMPIERREDILSRFKAGEFQVMSNCMVLTEGFDAPVAKTVVLARPTKSVSLYLQMAGRCLRPFESKDCIILDHADSYHTHGEVNQDWQWSLEAVKGDPKGWMCENCYFVNEAKDTSCAQCSCARKVKETKQAGERAEIEEVKTELVQVGGYQPKAKRKANSQERKIWDELWRAEIVVLAGTQTVRHSRGLPLVHRPDSSEYVSRVFFQKTKTAPASIGLYPPPGFYALSPWDYAQKVKVLEAWYEKQTNKTTAREWVENKLLEIRNSTAMPAYTCNRHSHDVSVRCEGVTKTTTFALMNNANGDRCCLRTTMLETMKLMGEDMTGINDPECIHLLNKLDEESKSGPTDLHVRRARGGGAGDFIGLSANFVDMERKASPL